MRNRMSWARSSISWLRNAAVLILRCVVVLSWFGVGAFDGAKCYAAARPVPVRPQQALTIDPIQHQEELNRRLTRIESLWFQGGGAQAKAEDLSARLKAVDDLVSAGARGKAARKADSIIEMLTGGSSAWIDPLMFVPDVQIVDAKSTSIDFTIVTIYARADVRRFGMLGETVGPFEANGYRFRLLLDGHQIGDIVHDIQLFDGDFDERIRSVRYSRSESLTERINRLNVALIKLQSKAPSIESSTLQLLVESLTRAERGHRVHDGLPLSKMLTEAEQVNAALEADVKWYGPARCGDYWLRVPTEAAHKTSFRLLVPELPGHGPGGALVVCVPGRLGGYHSYFGGFPCSGMSEACRARGWYLLTPIEWSSVEDINEMIRWASTRFPLESQRVFLVGQGDAADTLLAAQCNGLIKSTGTVLLGPMAPPSSPLSGCGRGEYFVALGEVTSPPNPANSGGWPLEMEGIQVKLYRPVPHQLVAAAALSDLLAWCDAIVSGRR